METDYESMDQFVHCAVEVMFNDKEIERIDDEDEDGVCCCPSEVAICEHGVAFSFPNEEGGMSFSYIPLKGKRIDVVDAECEEKL